METKLEPVCSTLCPSCGETGGDAGAEVPAPTPTTDVLVGASCGAGVANAGVAKVAQTVKKAALRIDELIMKTPLEKQQKQLEQFKSLKDLYGNALKENQRLKLLIDEQQALLDEKNLVIRQLENKVDESSEVVVISNA